MKNWLILTFIFIASCSHQKINRPLSAFQVEDDRMPAAYKKHIKKIRQINKTKKSKRKTVFSYINKRRKITNNALKTNDSIQTSRPYWKLTFFDDFKGKPDSSNESVFCYDEVKPQCHLWAGSSSYDCARNNENFNKRKHAGETTLHNIKTALSAEYPEINTENLTFSELLDTYKEKIELHQKHLNKCIWTNYETINWMATDYNGKWSARFEPLMVKVKPEGKGYLELRAKKTDAKFDCAFGGNLIGNECLLSDLTDVELSNENSYYVHTDNTAPGVYYKAPSCPIPLGCKAWSAPTALLDTKDVQYYVKLSPIKGIYYSNIKYRCKENITYHNGVGFKNLNCPIMNGGLNSAYFKAIDNDEVERGLLQKNGRFEVKFRIPKGRGAFPAAWLMPKTGGWPYRGGEIDIIEARDNANEIYQTYHHGKCFIKSSGNEIIYSLNDPSKTIDSGECKNDEGLNSVHFHKGFTVKEREINQFHQRDHVFAVEWIGNNIQHFTNGEKTNHIYVGAKADLNDPAQPGRTWDDLPQGGDQFLSHNFPTDPFYYILNHSTYVSDEYLQNNEWPDQKVLIDYVKTFQLCQTDLDFCPKGGTFIEGQGCRFANGSFTKSACTTNEVTCPNGGISNGAECNVQNITQTLRSDIEYWVDSDPRWPGIYYRKINNACPYGGSGSVNCQLTSIPENILEDGIDYKIDKNKKQVIYRPTFVNESTVVGPGTSVEKCPGLRKELGSYYGKTVCKALPHFKIKRSKCDGSFWNNYCIWDKGTWYRARQLKD